MKGIKWFFGELSGANNREYWEQRLQEQRKRHAREVLARLEAAGIRSNENSTIDGFSDKELREGEGQQGG